MHADIVEIVLEPARPPLDSRLQPIKTIRMKTPEWPSVATAVGILTILTIIVAIAADPDFRLKDWQTLMAALIALFAASFAYRGAMAKVEHDREVYREEQRRRRLNLFLKTALTCKMFGRSVESLRTWLNPPNTLTGIRYTERRVSRDELVIPLEPEFEEAWNNLDVYPPAVVVRLANIRNNITTLNRAAQADPDAEWTFDITNVPLEIYKTQEILADIYKWSKEAAEALEQVVDQAAA